jgi:hypothetical protein
MRWGVTIPWTPFVATAFGLWPMLSPTLFGTQSLTADSSRLGGVLVVTFAVIARDEPACVVRFVNIPFSAWILFRTLAASWDTDCRNVE